MAALFMRVFKILLLLTTLFFTSLNLVTPFKFDVGDDGGWAVPTSQTDQIYNQWAARNRFRVNDTIQFKYVNDSVKEVTKKEYESCGSSHPAFFSDTGDTAFVLDRPGLFYFISGVPSHCFKGEKMIIKVLEESETGKTGTTATNSTETHPNTTETALSNGVTRPFFCANDLKLHRLVIVLFFLALLV